VRQRRAYYRKKRGEFISQIVDLMGSCIVSQMHPDPFNSSMLVEESQLLSQGSMDISPYSPEFVDPMPDA